MKIKNLLLLAAAASLGMSAFAQSNGEFADFANGTPTQDHFFVRGTYNDMGSDQTMDNVLFCFPKAWLPTLSTHRKKMA